MIKTDKDNLTIEPLREKALKVLSDILSLDFVTEPEQIKARIAMDVLIITEGPTLIGNGKQAEE